MASAGSGEKQDGFQLRRLSTALAFGVLLVAVAGWYFLADGMVHWLTSRDIENFVLRSRDSSDQIATNLARNLQDEVRRLSNLPEVLTGDVLLRAPLVGRLDPQSRAAAIQEADERLRELADLYEVDIVYLLGADGVCIAASNYQSERTVVGIDLKARQYFTTIQNGGRGRQFAFGNATGVPGVYFSSPINKDLQFAGGVVVKRNMRGLFHLTTRNAAFLVDEYGVVVASTIEAALWHYLPDSAAAGLGTDFLRDRYRQETMSLIDIRADHSLASVSLVYLMAEEK